MSQNNSLLVIGAGLPRTGTASLKKALEIIYHEPCYHMFEIIDNHIEHADLWKRMLEASRIVDKPMVNEKLIQMIFRGYRTVTDAPTCALYEPLMSLYPEAKIILTVRDAKAWIKSVRQTVRPNQPILTKSIPDRFVEWLALRPGFTNMTEECWYQFCGPNTDMTNDEQLVRAFEKWNMKVQSKVPKNKLLVFDVRMGWKPLCEFLNVPVPQESFPHVNDQVQFREHICHVLRLKRLVRIGLLVFGVGLAGLCWRFRNMMF